MGNKQNHQKPQIRKENITDNERKGFHWNESWMSINNVSLKCVVLVWIMINGNNCLHKFYCKVIDWVCRNGWLWLLQVNFELLWTLYWLKYFNIWCLQLSQTISFNNEHSTSITTYLKVYKVYSHWWWCFCSRNSEYDHWKILWSWTWFKKMKY